MTKGHLRNNALVFDDQKEQGPEASDSEPSEEAVRKLEGIVPAKAHTWKREEEDDHKHSQGQVANGQSCGRVNELALQVHAGERGAEQDEPYCASVSSTAVEATILVDLGKDAT